MGLFQGPIHLTLDGDLPMYGNKVMSLSLYAQERTNKKRVE